ncbi:Myrrcad domain-containing protein [Mycoplasma feriruminatoris]|uniref:BspA family leucine-rich repeat surface protein n=1 Tax=Mycoplasma feriruminatoris TaxID=1179777 RepID=UPI0024202482|nr:BspA family leucine-rich repeat surface protein [Mycoplasma feriruminatoris]WFQ90750.1 Myrrcad domain-containing protein [Mycoplasma feriruminatoris]
MKKLLTILTSTSAVFLITAGVMLVNRNNGDNNIYLNKQIQKKNHTIQGDKLTEVGYYWDGYEKHVRIQKIPPQVKYIAAPLPPQITSLKGAFSTRIDNVIWQVEWDTKNIKNMNSMFYNTTWFNSSSIVNWDTSNVEDMGKMFGRTGSFNQDLSKWDVSKVKNFKEMFSKAKEFNNGGKPLNWKDKLVSAENMESMFYDASEFKHSLEDWKLEKEVNNTNFGLSSDKQPKWKEKATKPTSSTSSVPTNISSRSDEANEIEPLTQPSPTNPDNLNNNSTLNLPDNIDNSNEVPNMVNPNPEPKTDSISSEKIEENTAIKKEENETISVDKTKNSRNNDIDIYKIPSVKPYTTNSYKSKTNAGAIAGSVLGTFTVVGAGAGVGYYYRNPLRKFYFKSKERIKDKILKIKSK